MKPVSVTYVTPGRYTDEDEDQAGGGAMVPYSAQERQGLVRRAGPVFVAADRKPITPARIEVLPPAQPPDTRQPAQVQNIVTGDHLSRARGFALVTNRLGLTLGGLGVIVAVVGTGAPLFSLAVLGWFGGLYALTWLIAYIVHVVVSAEGAAWMHVLRGWRWLDREQAHRHRLERHANGIEE